MVIKIFEVLEKDFLYQNQHLLGQELQEKSLELLWKKLLLKEKKLLWTLKV